MLLADAGKHPAPAIADLLVAAAAELSDMTVLHVDKASSSSPNSPVSRFSDCA
jgi:predicted nucleic acid-binding protein